MKQDDTIYRRAWKLICILSAIIDILIWICLGSPMAALAAPCVFTCTLTFISWLLNLNAVA